ncbi:MAG TPA: CPBP family intramembrane glutamic endopeptidase [Acidimicrobiia bacterium]|nr:CPBP family intramembrane glutamic endopeptidase [Acidimicrobiia bacterium]
MTPRWTLVDLVLVVLGALAGSLIGGAAAAVFTEDTNTILLASFAGQFVGTVGVIWLIGRSRGLGTDSLGFDIRPLDTFYLGIGIVLQIAIALLFLPLQQILVPEGGPSQDLTEMFGRLDHPAARVAMIAIATFLAPVSEELMFRGVLLRALAGRSRRTILVVSSLVFAFFHLAGTPSGGAAVLVFVQIFLVGLVLAHLTLRHDRLGPAIFVHAGFNLLASVILFLPPEVLEQLGQNAG